jgi:phosphopantetheine adenylyltransferase
MMATRVIKNRTIMKQFKNDSNLTLTKMAENYGMSEEEFLEAIKRVCGKENFSQLQRINAKRIKAGKGKPEIIKDEDEAMKATVGKELIAQKESIKQQMATVNNDTPKEDSNMEKNVEKLQERLQEVNAIISTITGQIEANTAIYESITAELADLEQRVNSLRLEEAEKSVEIQEKQAQLDNAKAEVIQIQNEIDALTKVILIAPRYKGGKVSKTLRMVSTKGREGIEVEKVPKEEWISKPTWDAFVNSGHKDRDSFEEDFEFVQLVLKYQVEGKKFELRANDTIKSMINFEGGEV